MREKEGGVEGTRVRGREEQRRGGIDHSIRTY